MFSSVLLPSIFPFFCSVAPNFAPGPLLRQSQIMGSVGNSVDDPVDSNRLSPSVLSLLFQVDSTQHSALGIGNSIEYIPINGSNLSAENGVASHEQIPSVTIQDAERSMALCLASTNSPLQIEEDCSLAILPRIPESTRSPRLVLASNQHLTLPKMDIRAGSPFSVSSEGSEDHPSSHQVTEDEWRARKDELHRLYMTENLPLREIMEIFGQRQFFPTQVHELFSVRCASAYT